MKTKIFLISCISSFIISCSSNQSGSPFGDFKASTCTSANCSSSLVTPEPSFERDNNADVILDKYDNTLEVVGKCRMKDIPDSDIQIQITNEAGTQRSLTDGFVPIVGVTAVAGRSAKCENGRWGIAINACNNLMGVAGAHRIDLTLKGKDKNGRAVDIQDGHISMNLIRANDCDSSVL